jgi:hypothetical protein
MAVLMQEALASIGIKAQINKIPGATWRAALLKKDMPMIINRFGGWLDYPEYFFFWCYHGQNAVFNTMSYQNPKLDKIITNARFAESKPIYDSSVREMIQIAYDEVPRIPLFQPTMDVAMQKDVHGLHVLVPPAARLPAAVQGLRRPPTPSAAPLKGGNASRQSEAVRRVVGSRRRRRRAAGPAARARAPPGRAALPQLAAGMAPRVMDFPLAPADESGNVFVPVEAPKRERREGRRAGLTCPCACRPAGRIEATDGRVNAFTAVLAERALARAEAVDARGRAGRWPACPSR